MNSTATRDTVIAANRFGLGAAPGELEHIGGQPREWLLAQVATDRPVPDGLQAAPGSAEGLAEFLAFRNARRMRPGEGEGGGTMAAEDMDMGTNPGRLYRRHMMARSVNAIHTSEPFHERLVHFWSNHFAVSVNKGLMNALAGPFEVEAIRPNVCGFFSDLLLAAEKHAAMLAYLDNDKSMGAGSVLGEELRVREPERSFGINENLGREILELHTLGVAGGYTQEDVTSFSRALTGWSIGGIPPHKQGSMGAFEFKAPLHEPGAKTVLGKTYPDAGLAQGEAILRDLAAHPATATHIATKLARHFIGDKPPAAAVGSIAAAFRSSEGHLPTVYAAVIESGEAWTQVRTKYKSPREFVYSACRAVAYFPEEERELLTVLRSLGQNPWQPGSPAGWPDTAAAWAGAQSLYHRAEFSLMLAQRAGRPDPEQVAGNALGPTITNHTVKLIRQAETAEQALTLLLASPEFQRR